MPPRYCVECGQLIPDGSVFCPQCGTQATGTVNPIGSPPSAIPANPIQPTIVAPLGPLYQRPPSNGMATAGFVLSLVGLFFFFLVIPIVLGIIFSSIGISRARVFEETTGQPVGRGLAIAGLIISLVNAFGWLVILAAAA